MAGLYGRVERQGCVAGVYGRDGGRVVRED